MKVHPYILLIFIIIFFLFAFIAVINYEQIIIINNRLESQAIASGWAGFNQLSLEQLAIRETISNREKRHLILNKAKAEEITKEYLKKNLELDNQLFPLPSSYISDKTRPVILNITAYNTGDPGNPAPYTTIEIEIDYPISLSPKGYLDFYARKTVLANYDTFLIYNQLH